MLWQIVLAWQELRLMARMGKASPRGAAQLVDAAARDQDEDVALPDVTAKAWTRLGDGGRVVIPADIRRQLGLKTGDQIMLIVEDGELHLITARQGVQRAQELAKSFVQSGASIVDELIAERRAEAARE